MDVDYKLLASCTLCPRNCGVNRLAGEKGYCGAGAGYETAAVTVHMGEEPLISGENGICNVFFYHCNLQCLYCQNFQISRKHSGASPKKPGRVEVLADIRRILDSGVENLGFVSPSHMLPQMIDIIKTLNGEGYRPIVVYNTNAFEKPETLRLIEPWVDVYLPDFKYADAAPAEKWSAAREYPETAARAIREMYFQKGNTLSVNAHGKADRGLIIRHLVLPGEVDNSINVLRHIADELSNRISISLMSQYHPAAPVHDHPQLGRRLHREEYLAVCREMEALGFSNGWVQEFDSADNYLPDFSAAEPFGS